MKDHPRRAIVVKDSANTKSSPVICKFFQEMFEDELEKMGVHAELRRSAYNDSHELVLRFHDFGVVSMPDDQLAPTTDWFQQRTAEVRGMLASMKAHIQERVTRNEY